MARVRGALSRPYPPADSIRRCLSQGAVLQQHRVKLETKPKKFEDRVLVRALGLGAEVSRAAGLLRAESLGGRGDRGGEELGRNGLGEGQAGRVGIQEVRMGHERGRTPTAEGHHWQGLHTG